MSQPRRVGDLVPLAQEWQSLCVIERLACRQGRPVAAAVVGELLHALLITAVVAVGRGAAGFGGVARVAGRRYRPEAARATYPPKSVRAAPGGQAGLGGALQPAAAAERAVQR